MTPSRWNWSVLSMQVAYHGALPLEDLPARFRAPVAEAAGPHRLCLVVDTTGCRLIFKPEARKHGGSEPGRRLRASK